jgi:hypothetical protein
MCLSQGGLQGSICKVCVKSRLPLPTRDTA